MNRNDNGTFKRNLVYGVGIDDVIGSKERLVGGKRVCEQYYVVWKNMLKRCYHNKGEYLGSVVVCKEWHTLSNFKTWFEENHIESYELDKDIFGGKIYSPNTCVFISKKLNIYITSVRKHCGSYYDKQRSLYQSYTKGLDSKRINIGRFKTDDEAVFYAKTVKMFEINKLLAIPDLPNKLRVGIYRLLEDLYVGFILPKVTQVGNCTFLDTGGVFKKFDNGYDLSIVRLEDYI